MVLLMGCGQRLIRTVAAMMVAGTFVVVAILVAMTTEVLAVMAILTIVTIVAAATMGAERAVVAVIAVVVVVTVVSRRCGPVVTLVAVVMLEAL